MDEKKSKVHLGQKPFCDDKNHSLCLVFPTVAVWLGLAELNDQLGDWMTTWVERDERVVRSIFPCHPILFSTPLFDFTPWAWRNMNGICITQKQSKTRATKERWIGELQGFCAHRSGKEGEREGTSLFTVQYMTRDHVLMLERW